METSAPSTGLCARNHPALASYTNALLSIEDAQHMFGFERTSFYRFRKDYRILLLAGRRIHVGDVVRAFERQRRRDHSAIGFSHITIDQAVEYRAKVLTLPEAKSAFGISSTTLWRLRQRYSIPMLSVRRIHADDIIAALNASRTSA